MARDAASTALALDDSEARRMSPATMFCTCAIAARLLALTAMQGACAVMAGFTGASCDGIELLFA